MKRSEMIELVANDFAAFIDNNTESTPRKMVDHILERLESLGMEPPKVKKTITLEKRVDPNRIFSYDQYLNEWESENQ